jgi:hypothetical protein
MAASMQQQPTKARPKVVRTNVLFALLLLVACLQMILISIFSGRIENHASDPSHVMHKPNMIQPQQQVLTRKDKRNTSTLNMIFAGISYSDDTISETAIQYLMEAACKYHIQSHVLLSKRTHKTSLEHKIYLLGQHRYMRLAKGGTARQPACTELIHITTAPSDEQLIGETLTRMQSTGEINELLSEGAPNNPLDPENRVARIKRVREYQRQMIRDNVSFTQSHVKQSIIAMMDLDMFDYPPISKLIEVTEKYMLNSSTSALATYDAICANGVQRSRYKEHFPHRGYYDSFATLLLPNTWPVGEDKRTVPRGLLKGENVTLSKLSVRGLLDYFLKEGSTNSENTYNPVPVRSCFGGLTLYRADAWLSLHCRYDLYNKSVDVYRGKEEHQTCEHVVLHECLREKYNDFRIAVQPDMTTLWHLM